MKREFRVLIAGSRDFNNYNLLKAKLDFFLSNKVKEDYEIITISGTARGADKLGERYANERGYKIERHPADWSIGRHAGYVRNSDMADVSDVGILFWDGISRGTKHMYDTCLKKNVPVEMIEYK